MNIQISGDFSRLIPLTGISGTVKRTVRSTLAAEAYAVSEGVETAQFVRHVLQELLHDPRKPGSTLQQVEKVRWKIPIVCCTDSDNLDKSIKTDAGSMRDKRLRIVVAMLREVVELEPWLKILWINTQRMVADGLTKIDSPLISLIEGFMTAERVTFPKNTKTKEISNISAWLQIGAEPSAPQAFISNLGQDRGHGRPSE